MPDQQPRWTEQTRDLVERAIEAHGTTAVAVIRDEHGGTMRHECGCGEWWRPLDDDDWPELHDAHQANAVLAALADAGLLATPGVWSLPAEPPAEVKAVRDREGQHWHRDGGGWSTRPDSLGTYRLAWVALLVANGPLADATGSEP